MFSKYLSNLFHEYQAWPNNNHGQLTFKIRVKNERNLKNQNKKKNFNQSE